MSGDLPGLSPTRGYDWQQWTPGAGLRSPWTAGHSTPGAGAGCRGQGAGCRGREQSNKYWCQLRWRSSFYPIPHKPTFNLLRVLPQVITSSAAFCSNMDIYNVCNNDSVFIPSTMAIYGLQDCNSAKATLILRKLWAIWANRGSLKAHEKLSKNIM